MKQSNVRANEEPLAFMWLVNCTLYSVVVSFLLTKNWMKKTNTKAPETNEGEKRKLINETQAKELGRKISIATAELERL